MNAQQKISRITNSKQLPTLPEVAQRLIELANQSEPDNGEVCRAIKSDPATACKIIRTVNSALFAFRPRIETVEQAVPKLGTSLIRTLILNFHFASMKTGSSSCRTMLQDYWKFSVSQAAVAETLAEQSGQDPHYFFMAGMLNDVGILAMINEFPAEYQEHVYRRCQLPNVVDAEQQWFGFSHTEVTIELLKSWNMSDELIRMIRLAHVCDETFPAGNNGKGVEIMRAANWGARILLSQPDDSESIFGEEFERWRESVQEQLSISLDWSAGCLTDSLERVDEISATYGFDIGDPICTQAVLQNAKDLLHDIALSKQLDQIGQPDATTSKELRDRELYTDCLTGLFNRRYVEEVLKPTIGNWIKEDREVAVVFLDADQFKTINDKYGHAAGDSAIVHIGKWLDKNTRREDPVVRLGGDEFLMVFQAGFKTVEKIMQGIINKIPALVLDDGVEVPVSLSGGCAVRPACSDSTIVADDLINHADKLMYQSKELGGGDLQIANVQKPKKLMGMLFG